MVRKVLKSEFILLFLVFFLMHGCVSSKVMQTAALSPHTETSKAVDICFGFGCKKHQRIELKGAEWGLISRLFSYQAISPEIERQTIAKAIAFMEKMTGKQSVTWQDQAENNGAGTSGQMDCIDESTNTRTYLTLFEKNGWLKWHKVRERAVRHPLFVDYHWTEVVEDTTTGQLYAIDSWFRANGEKPIIGELEDWKHKKFDP